MHAMSNVSKGAKSPHYLPPGTRVVLDHMPDDPFPVQDGTWGTVDYTDDAGHLHMIWENGRTLALIPGVDQYHEVTGKDIKQRAPLVKSVIKQVLQYLESSCLIYGWLHLPAFLWRKI